MNEKRSGRCPALGLLYVMALSFGFFVCFSHAQDLPPEVAHYADTVFFNGHVLTMDSDKAPFILAKALAVRDGKVLMYPTNLFRK